MNHPHGPLRAFLEAIGIGALALLLFWLLGAIELHARTEGARAALSVMDCGPADEQPQPTPVRTGGPI